MNIIFDATVIANFFEKNSSRSGIFFVAKNILDGLLIRPDVHILFYFSSGNIENSIRVHEELYPDVPCVQNLKKYNWLIRLKKKLLIFYKKLQFTCFIKKVPALGICVLDRILKNTLEQDCDYNLMRVSNCFVSPFYKVPKVIRKYEKIRSFIFIYDAIPMISSNWNGSLFVKEVCETVKESDVFFYISENTQYDIERLFPIMRKCESQIIYPAASKSFAKKRDNLLIANVKEKYKIPQNKKYVFSLCTIEPRKNLIRAVRCFISFVEKYNIDDLVWVMGGGHWESFIKELKKNSVSWNPKYIIQAGYIDDEDLPVLYSNAEWFVYTSQYEGFGLPPLEAMQCGCPVITSNNSSLPEVVGDAGIMIDWDSDEQHVEAYEQYYFNEELRKENSRKGLERSKQFSWGNAVDMIVNAIKKSVS